MRSILRCSALALGVGVGIISSGPVPALAGESSPPTVQIMVQNDGASDVVVYAYRGGARMRIGFVLSHSHGVVTVPAGMIAPGRVQVLLHTEPAGEDFLADEVHIRAGQEHAELRVTSELAETSLTVVPGVLRL